MTADTTIKPTGAMSEDDLATALAADLEDSATYSDTELGPLRASAIHYYRGRLFGDEEDGRSQVVMPVVRDTIRATLPSLMKKFYGARDVVKFTAANDDPQAAQMAEDATATVLYVFNTQNSGFHLLWNSFKDALRCKTGWLKWWWDESVEVTASTYSDVTEQQLLVFEATKLPGQELQIVSKTIAGYQPLPPGMAPPQAPAGVGPAPSNSPVRETGEGLQIPGPPLDTGNRLGLQEGGGGGLGSEFNADHILQPDTGADDESAHDVYGAQEVPSVDDDLTFQGAGSMNEGMPAGSAGLLAAGRQYSLATQPAQTPMRGAPVYTYTVRLVSKRPVKKVRIEAVPPDEIIFPHDTWSLDHARLIAHRTRKTRGELVAMGVKPEDLESIPSDDVDQLTNLEFLARQTIPSSVMTQAQSATWDQVRVPYYESYYRVDFDGDGISELRKICRIGKTGKIVSNEIWDDVPLAMLCPDPEPHVIVGLSQADYVMDIQNVESHVWRDLLDSLKQSIFPRMAYVEGQANLDDVLNSEIGAAIRMRAPGMVQPLTVPFTGQQAYPMLEKLDQVREKRTGIGQAAMALDASALQSTTPTAAQASIGAAEAQVQLTALIFAFAIARMFKGVLKLLIRHQNQEMQFQITGRGSFSVNPQQFNPDMQLEVDVGLGDGTQAAQQLEALDGVAKAQVMFLQQMGPNNPICSLNQYYNTVTDMLKLAGFKDPSRYWTNPQKTQWGQQAQQQGPQMNPPQPTPEQIKAQSDQSIEAARLRKDNLQIVLQDERERYKLEIDARLRALEIHAKYGAAVNTKTIDALMQREQMRSDEAINQANLDAAPAPAQGAQ